MRILFKPPAEVFAKMAWDAAVRAEREACAKVCEEAELRFAGLRDRFAYPSDQGAADACSQVAAAIRLRGKE